MKLLVGALQDTVAVLVPTADVRTLVGAEGGSAWAYVNGNNHSEIGMVMQSEIAMHLHT